MTISFMKETLSVETYIKQGHLIKCQARDFFSTILVLGHLFKRSVKKCPEQKNNKKNHFQLIRHFVCKKRKLKYPIQESQKLQEYGQDHFSSFYGVFATLTIEQT